MSKRLPETTHPGLANPEAATDKAATPTDPTPSTFRTHIAEPRWQQVASIIFVILAAAIWWGFILHRF